MLVVAILFDMEISWKTMKPICLTNDTVPTGENTQRKGVKGRKDMERHGKMTKGAEAAETSSSNL